jgi:chorismate mutase/prephenate dehydratase
LNSFDFLSIIIFSFAWIRESTVDTIERLRRSIDAIDAEILKLLNQRAELAIDIGKEKSRRKAPYHVPEREREIYEQLEGINKGPFPNDALRAVFREIISATLSLEEPLTVAYLGPRATFTHMACQTQFGLSARYLPFNSIHDVFEEVERDRVIYGVIPIENSIEGVVNHTLDMFVDSNLMICGEVSLEIGHNLLAQSEDIKQVTKIYSHPHAIAQCRGWLENNMPSVPIYEVYSTAKAAEMVLEEPTAAAIASEAAAQLYGLKIVKKRIETHLHNFTRFLVIGKTPTKRSGDDKTSILFSIKDKVGALHSMLEPFANHGINLTKIESRPSRKKVWEYVFFVDMEGHVEDAEAREAIDELAEKCIFLKVLGSYPRSTIKR